MAAPSLDASMRAGDDVAEVQRLLEKSLRDIRAVDLEALCIAAGRKVTSSPADVHMKCLSVIRIPCWKVTHACLDTA